MIGWRTAVSSLGSSLIATVAVLAFLPLQAANARPPLERFADLPITIDTPAFANGKRDFTTDAEMAQFIARLDLQTDHMIWRVLGKTPGGRDMHALLFTADGKASAFEMALNRKPVVWIIGQQHGNEPAGGEACLEIARRLAVGDLRALLERLNVVIVPRANPDGAAANRREVQRDGVLIDSNRDHLLLASPENQMLHRAMRAMPPHMVIDAHEFLAIGRWIEKFGVAQASDMLLQSASHPEVADAIRAVTRDVFDPALDAAFKRSGVKTFAYHTLNTSGEKPYVQMGGNFAGIGRNAFGLYGAVSYLLESRGIGLEKQFFQRRVASHVIAMAALLRTAAANTEQLNKAVRLARNGWTGDIMIDFTTRREMREVPMYEPISGEDKPLKIEMQNMFAVTPTLSRAVPAGYLLAADQIEAAQRLAQHGVRVIRIVQTHDVSAERYIVRGTRQEPGDQGAPMDRITADTQTQNISAQAGMFYVPIAQPMARIAALALEPESVGSFASVHLLKTPVLTPGADLPVWRVVLPVKLAGPLVEPN